MPLARQRLLKVPQALVLLFADLALGVKACLRLGKLLVGHVSLLGSLLGLFLEIFCLFLRLFGGCAGGSERTAGACQLRRGFGMATFQRLDFGFVRALGFKLILELADRLLFLGVASLRLLELARLLLNLVFQRGDALLRPLARFFELALQVLAAALQVFGTRSQLFTLLQFNAQVAGFGFGGVAGGACLGGFGFRVLELALPIRQRLLKLRRSLLFAFHLGLQGSGRGAAAGAHVVQCSDGCVALGDQLLVFVFNDIQGALGDVAVRKGFVARGFYFT